MPPLRVPAVQELTAMKARVDSFLTVEQRLTKALADWEGTPPATASPLRAPLPPPALAQSRPRT